MLIYLFSLLAIREKFCHTNSDCIEIKNTECTEEKKCSCKLNHVIENKTACEPLLGEFCTTNKGCVISNSICNINKCQCDRYYVAKSNNQCELCKYTISINLLDKYKFSFNHLYGLTKSMIDFR